MTKKEKIFLCIIMALILIVIFMACVAKKYYDLSEANYDSAEANFNHYINACDQLWYKDLKIMELENKINENNINEN